MHQMEKYKEENNLNMYLNPEVAQMFARREQNEKHRQVAEAVDEVLMRVSRNMTKPLKVAELGGGAHLDRYHKLFSVLLQSPGSRIDWVDTSAPMLDEAKRYLSQPEYSERNRVINFIKKDIFQYLKNADDNSIDIAIMKYTFEYIQNIKQLFALLKRKLKEGGVLVATVNTNPRLPSYSTNARFFYKGQPIPDGEERILKDSDKIIIKFFTESGNPQADYLPGAETFKYFHSAEKVKALAGQFGFGIFLGDWKDFVGDDKQVDNKLDQEILVLVNK